MEEERVTSGNAVAMPLTNCTCLCTLQPAQPDHVLTSSEHVGGMIQGNTAAVALCPVCRVYRTAAQFAHPKVMENAPVSLYIIQPGS